MLTVQMYIRVCPKNLDILPEYEYILQGWDFGNKKAL